MPLLGLLRPSSNPLPANTIDTLTYLARQPALLQDLLSTLSALIKLARNSLYLYHCLSALVPLLSGLLPLISSPAFLRSLTFLFHQITSILQLNLLLSYQGLSSALLSLVKHCETFYSDMDHPTRVLMSSAVKNLMRHLTPEIL